MLDATPPHLCAELLSFPEAYSPLRGQCWIQAEPASVQQSVPTDIPPSTAANVQRRSLQATCTVSEQTERGSAIATHAMDGTWK